MHEANVKTYATMILSIPRSIWFNFRYLPWKDARHLPILISWNTKVLHMKRGRIAFEGDMQRFMVKIGFGWAEKMDARRTRLSLDDGIVTFHGRATLSAGTLLANSGDMYIGDNVYTNINATIWAENKIHIGDDVLMGWNVFIRDHDGHHVYVDGKEKEDTAPIHIGDHTWLCSETTILKGAGIGNGSILGYGSLLTKQYDEEHALYAGIPAKRVRCGVDWKL